MICCLFFIYVDDCRRSIVAILPTGASYLHGATVCVEEPVGTADEKLVAERGVGEWLHVFIIIFHPGQVSDLKTDPTPTAPSVDNTSAADREKLENALEEQIIQTLQTQKELARYKVLTWNLFPIYMQYRLEK